MHMKFTYRFEAAHRFLKSSSRPCMTPHGHSWYVSLRLEFLGSTLNDDDMSVEFSKVKKDFRCLVQETLDHSYLHNIKDPVVEVLGAEARLLPFPGDPTTELISLFLFHKVSLMIAANDLQGSVQVHSIKLQETATNTLYCDRDFYLNNIKAYEGQEGWWNQANPLDRSYGNN